MYVYYIYCIIIYNINNIDNHSIRYAVDINIYNMYINIKRKLYFFELFLLKATQCLKVQIIITDVKLHFCVEF